MSSAPPAAAAAAPTSASQLLAQGEALKAQGNAAYGAGEYAAALRAYKHVILVTRSLASQSAAIAAVVGGPALGGADAVAFNALLLTIHTNLAATYLKMRDFEKALKYAREARQLDAGGSHIKSMLREAQALRGLGRTADAAAGIDAAVARHSTGRDAIWANLVHERAELRAELAAAAAVAAAAPTSSAMEEEGCGTGGAGNGGGGAGFAATQ